MSDRLFSVYHTDRGFPSLLRVLRDRYRISTVRPDGRSEVLDSSGESHAIEPGDLDRQLAAAPRVATLLWLDNSESFYCSVVRRDGCVAVNLCPEGQADETYGELWLATMLAVCQECVDGGGRGAVIDPEGVSESIAWDEVFLGTGRVLWPELAGKAPAVLLMRDDLTDRVRGIQWCRLLPNMWLAVPPK